MNRLVEKWIISSNGTISSLHSYDHNSEVYIPSHSIIDQFHKSQNTPVPSPKMLHSEQKCAHFCSEWSILGHWTGEFWGLWIRSIPLIWPMTSLCTNVSCRHDHINCLNPYTPGNTRVYIQHHSYWWPGASSVSTVLTKNIIYWTSSTQKYYM